MKRLIFIGAWLALLAPAPRSSRAQTRPDQGPMAPASTYDVRRIPAEPNPPPPSIPQQEIISKFAANEDAMKKIYDTYDFTINVHIDELEDSGGKLTAAGEVLTNPEGKRVWRVTTPVASTLHSAIYSLEEVRTMITMPLFFLTTEEIANYNFVYAGHDNLDQLDTYIFQVKPKQHSTSRRFFDGVIWVDDHDFAIVKSYGKFVGPSYSERDALPFKMFEIYRENFQGKYWLPTYTVSDDYIARPASDQLHLRLVIRSSDFKLQSTSPPASDAPPAAAATPLAPPATPPDPAPTH